MNPTDRPQTSSLSDTLLLEMWERIMQLDDTAAMLAELESTASQLYGIPCILRLPESPWAIQPGQAASIPIQTSLGAVVAHLTLPLDVDLAELRGAELLCKMVGWAISRGELLGQARECGEMMNDLKFGRRILEESLPASDLTLGEWEMSGFLRPAQHLGGDVYAYSVAAGRPSFLLADAVGHGLGSALLVSECRALWRGLGFEHDLSSKVARLSRLIYEDTGPERFVAATLGRCNEDGWIDYVACGQGPIFVVRAQGVEVFEDSEPPLGLFPDQCFSARRVHLEPGDCFVCSTDGILEWQDGAGELFGANRVDQALSGMHGRASSEVVASLFSAIDAFGHQESARDDACAVAVMRLPVGDTSG